MAAEVGRSPELIARLLREFGVAQPEPDGRLREDEVATLREPFAVWAAADDDELARLARVYGQNILKVVALDLELAGATIFARLRQEGYTDEEMRNVAGEVGLRLMNLGEQLMLWLRGAAPRARDPRRDRADDGGLPARARPRAEAHAQPSRDRLSRPDGLHGADRGARRRGGRDLAERLATLVHEAARPHGGNPVKWLGDGVMFHFEDPSAAVLTGLDLVEQTPAAVDVRARVGINAGNVIFRDGDYFGRTVNVAADCRLRAAR